MINIIPQTEVKLLKTPLEKDLDHTLSFTNINSQTTYFMNKVFRSYNDFTYQRETSTLVVPDTYDNICTCNYLMYRNNGFNTKYFYAFITKMEYISENSTRIYFEIDSLQTWYFQIEYKKSFIEREHVNDDSLGANTIPEGLETGEYIMAHAPSNELDDPDDFYICLAVSDDPYNAISPFSGVHRKYNGIFSGLYYIACKTFTDANSVVAIYDRNGKSDAINSIFMIPSIYISSLDTPQTWTYPLTGTAEYSASVYLIGDSSESELIGSIQGIFPTTVGDNYTPRNKKLLVHPYSYMVLSNNSGADVVYRYEDFKSTTANPVPTFTIEGSICPAMSMKAIPHDYKNSSGANYNYGLMLGKLPVCSWNTDVYVNWLTQNGVNNAVSIGMSAGTMVAGVASGNIYGVVSGASQAYNAVHERTVMANTPDQAKGNTNAGDVNFSYSKSGGLTLYYLSVRNEMARVIDEYFDKYGYRVNRLKTPNIRGRRNWNYVKTIGCDFEGDIPQEDLQKIKDIFNKGITFWHNSNNFLNYSANNDII